MILLNSPLYYRSIMMTLKFHLTFRPLFSTNLILVLLMTKKNRVQSLSLIFLFSSNPLIFARRFLSMVLLLNSLFALLVSLSFKRLRLPSRTRQLLIDGFVSGSCGGSATAFEFILLFYPKPM